MNVLRTIVLLPCATLALCQAPATVVSISYPRATMTTPTGVNNGNQIVGEFNPGNGTVRGFLRTPAGSYTEFTCASQADTHPTGINSSGAVAGYCGVPVVSYGFIRDAAGNMSRLDIPGASYTVATGINDAGQVTGYYGGSPSTRRGFVRDASGAITLFDVPGSTDTAPAAINASGQIAGTYGGVLTQAFVRAANGAITTFQAPGAVVSIDAAGRIFGNTNSPRTHWMRGTDGTIVPVAVPTVNETALTAVNDNGAMTGQNWTGGTGFLTLPCAAAVIGPATRQHGPGNEIGGISVTAPAGCSWTAVSYENWLAHPAGIGTGMGTQTYVVLPNRSGAARTGRLNVAGQIFTVSQTAGNCTYSVVGPQGVSPVGGSGLLTITTAPECGWVASPVRVQPYGVWEPVQWLSVSPSAGFGAGSTTFNATSCPACSAGILIGDQVHPITAGSQAFQVFVQDDATRAVTAWYMSGSSAVRTAALSGPVPGWRIAATADFDSNGARDLIWQHDSSGLATIWFMGGSSGTELLSWRFLGDGGAEWRVAAAAHFDTNGVPDIVWQNERTREATIWYMNVVNGAPALLEWAYLSGPQPGFRIVGVANTMLFGQVPSALAVFWQHESSGMVTAHLMAAGSQPRNSAVASWRVITPGHGPQWRVAGVAAVPDGQADLVWQNQVTRELTIWHMPQLFFAGWEHLNPASTPGARAIAR